MLPKGGLAIDFRGGRAYHGCWEFGCQAWLASLACRYYYTIPALGENKIGDSSSMAAKGVQQIETLHWTLAFAVTCWAIVEDTMAAIGTETCFPDGDGLICAWRCFNIAQHFFSVETSRSEDCQNSRVDYASMISRYILCWLPSLVAAV